MSEARHPLHDRRPPPALPQPELLFCAICQVSIPRSELENGEARRTPRGRVFCGACATSTPEERIRRREALENEFADDAPVALPVLVAEPRRVQPAPSDAPDANILNLRIGELERSTFRLRERVTLLEERLEAVLRRDGNAG